ncbi:MAG: double-cubane-cluster-containing anaerobic reductase [Synergistaceae bacterium]|nr:double-cubane-cluster-containing anaerobic reductase [Synergistaceae bacterium]
MHNIGEIIEKMREGTAMGPVRVKEIKERGIPVVGTYCTFTPWELINAAGGFPVSLCSTSEKPIAAAEKHLPRNLCPLIKSSYGFALTDTCPYFHFCDMVIGETTCDGKKKMYEYLGQMRHTHVMQLPQNVDGKNSMVLWKDEILRLKSVLEATFNTDITNEKLSASIKLRNRMHRTMMEFYDLSKLPCPVLTGKEIMLVSDYLKFSFDYEEAIKLVSDLTLKLKENYDSGERRICPGAKRILITGCPMGKSLEKVADAIESRETGGIIVGFENCGNLKCSSSPVDESSDPIDAITEKYLNIPCSVMSPNTKRLELIKKYVREYRAEGVIDVILQACHTYAVESHSVRECLQEAEIPYMAAETDYSQGDTGQLATRFGAFIEMI